MRKSAIVSAMCTLGEGGFSYDVKKLAEQRRNGMEPVTDDPDIPGYLSGLLGQDLVEKSIHSQGG